MAVTFHLACYKVNDWHPATPVTSLDPKPRPGNSWVESSGGIAPDFFATSEIKSSHLYISIDSLGISCEFTLISRQFLVYSESFY